MASGYGLSGGRPRCFPFWQDFQKCYISADNPQQECGIYKEDYFECLHHFKELARARKIAHQANKLKSQEIALQQELERKKLGESVAKSEV
ncbi:fiber protein Fb14 [Paraphysoderma sedebokerense]|nr:fiber protein Fb14 [Paraphysoderma sedebokerense]